MKNSKKHIPMFGLILGLTLVLVQSAFTPKKLAANWAYDHQLEEFVDISNKVMDNSPNPAPGTYSCLAGDECAGSYDGAGEPTSFDDLTDIVPGTYRAN